MSVNQILFAGFLFWSALLMLAFIVHTLEERHRRRRGVEGGAIREPPVPALQEPESCSHEDVANGKQAGADHNADDRTPPKRDTEHDDASASGHERRCRGQHEPTRQSFWSKAWTISQFLFTFALAVATSLNTYYVWHQWRTMERTLRQNQSLLKATKFQAIASSRAASAAQQSADAQVRAMKVAYRPRILFPTPIPPAPEITATGALRNWVITYANYGRGTATNITVSFPVKWGLSDRLQGDDRPSKAGAEGFPLSPLPPDTSAEARLPARNLNIPPEIAKGQGPFSVQTVIWYEDEFGDSHVSSHCIIYPLTGSDPPLCPHGNFSN